MIPDVEKDGEFAPFRRDAKLAGFRAVQSTPLVSTDGKPVGIVSTHFVNVHQPTHIEMDTLRSYGSVAAEVLFKLMGNVSLAKMVARMSEELESKMRGTASRRLLGTPAIARPSDPQAPSEV